MIMDEYERIARKIDAWDESAVKETLQFVYKTLQSVQTEILDLGKYSADVEAASCLSMILLDALDFGSILVSSKRKQPKSKNLKTE